MCVCEVAQPCVRVVGVSWDMAIQTVSSTCIQVSLALAATNILRSKATPESFPEYCLEFSILTTVTDSDFPQPNYIEIIYL